MNTLFFIIIIIIIIIITIIIIIIIVSLNQSLLIMVCTEIIWVPEEDLKSCMYRKVQGTSPSKVGQSCQIYRCQLSWIWAWIVRKKFIRYGT